MAEPPEIGTMITIGDTRPECLRVGVGVFSPYFWYIWQSNSFIGSFIPTFDLISQYAGFCYNVKYPVRTIFGVKLDNGTYTGLVGRMYRKEIDIMGPGLAPTPDRYEVMDFSPTFEVAGHTIMLPYPTLEPDIAGFIKPFTLQVWVLVAVILVLVVLAMWVTGYWHSFIDTKWKRSQREKRVKGDSILTGFSKAWMTALRIILVQDIPKNISIGYLLLGFWLIASLIIDVVYKSNLKAKLIAPRVRLEINDIEELSDYSGSLTNYLAPGTVFAQFAASHPPGHMYKRVADKATYTMDVVRVGDEVKAGDATFIMYRKMILFYMHLFFRENRQCKATMVKKFFFFQHLNFGIAWDNPYREKIKSGTLRLIESGIYEKQINDMIFDGEFCLNPENQKVDLMPLQMTDVLGVFSLYGAGIMVSIVAFTVEIILGRMGTDI